MNFSKSLFKYRIKEKGKIQSNLGAVQDIRLNDANFRPTIDSL